jgi:serine/threonine protein phosphatase 1
MRTLVIGDIHGCTTALRTLIGEVKPTPDDTLVTLGDYVDRGPDSKGTLDFLLELETKTNLVALLGNHEILFLDALLGRIDAASWLAVGGHETMLSYDPKDPFPRSDKVPDSHIDFLVRRCRRHHEDARHLFVHANANAYYPLEQQTDDWLFWTRFDDAFPHTSGKKMICGHTAQKTGLPSVRPYAICIDTWVYGEGWLTCLDLGNGTFVQANQAGEIRRASLQEVSGHLSC